MKTEVAIIGGGIIGICCAFYLQKAGFDLVVIEKGSIANEASYNNMCGLWPNHTSRPDSTKEFADSSLALFEEIAVKERFDFEFRRNGVLEVLPRGADIDKVERDVNERKSAGYDIRLLGPEEIAAMEPNLSKSFSGGIFCPRDANANSFLLAKEITTYLKNNGITVLEHAEVSSMLVDNGRITQIESSKGSISPEYVVNSAGPWSPFIGDLVGVSVPVQPAKGYMIETGPQRQFLSTAVLNGYIVITQRPAGQIRTGGTVEQVGFDREFASKKKEEIWKEACSVLPVVKGLTAIEYRTGFRPQTPDNLPIIGYSSKIRNLVLATGHFRRGFELATGTAKAVSELIQDGNTSVDISFATPVRFSL